MRKPCQQISTSFALLFLAKGRRPVLIAKARYGQTDDWDRHRADLAHLTGYVETKWKHDFPLGLSWQIVDLAEASVDDLLQSPVLYISGSQKLPLENQAKKLREYIDRGGFIFAEAVLPREFRLRQKFSPVDGTGIRRAGISAQALVARSSAVGGGGTGPPALCRNMWSVDHGCRTSVVYVVPAEQGDLPNGLSCYWEVAEGRDRKLPPAVQEQAGAA